MNEELRRIGFVRALVVCALAATATFVLLGATTDTEAGTVGPPSLVQAQPGSSSGAQERPAPAEVSTAVAPHSRPGPAARRTKLSARRQKLSARRQLAQLRRAARRRQEALLARLRARSRPARPPPPPVAAPPAAAAPAMTVPAPASKPTIPPSSGGGARGPAEPNSAPR